jgi:phosphatidylserine/phosphatidylglycerophosphate/cardiolipin synthase-like enzyme
MARLSTRCLLPAALALLAACTLSLDACAPGVSPGAAAQEDAGGNVALADWLAVPSDAPAVEFPEAVTWQVHFTNPEYRRRTGKERAGLDSNLAAFIGAARQTLDVAIFQLDLASATQALVAAQRRGVRVRVATDTDVLGVVVDGLSFRQLEAAGIAVVGGNPHAIMHDKFVVADGAAVWTGSWNFTANDTYRNNNNALVISSAHLAANYTQTFEKMFVQGRFGRARLAGGGMPRLILNGTHVENYFSPEDDAAGRIVAYVRSARASVDVMAFALTSAAIGQALAEAAQRGVTVRGVFERDNAASLYSQYLALKALAMDVVLDGNPDAMHHKVIIIDGRIVITGSYNFSDAAETANDENILIIDDTRLAQAYAGEFRRVWQEAEKATR